MLNVARLRVLRELSERGTIAATAEALSFSPSAVSQQLSTLEVETGLALLERAGRGVRLTDAGRLLARNADRILAEIERAESELDEAREGVRGTVVVSVFPSAGRGLLPPALAAVRTRYPHVEVVVSELEPAPAVDALRLAEVDVVITHANAFGIGPRPEFADCADLYSEPLAVALPAGHPLAGARGEAVDFRSLRDEPWIVGVPGTPCHDVIVRACNLAGYEPRISSRGNDFAMQLALVAAGHGAALIPRISHDQAPQGVVFRPTTPALVRTVFTATRPGAAKRAAVAALLEALRETAVEMERPHLAA